MTKQRWLRSWIALGLLLGLIATLARAQDTPPTDAPPMPDSGVVQDGDAVIPAPSAQAVEAADANDWGDASDSIGFGVAAAEAEASPAPTEPEPAALQGNGYFAHRLAFWSERSFSDSFAQARQTAGLGIRYKKRLHLGDGGLVLRLLGEGLVEHDFAYLHERERFDEATLDAYETKLIGRETYAALSWGALELTFGRQIVPFGQGDILSPLDIVNPRDSREPGLAELERVRMAVLASRAGLFVGPHRFEVLFVHESYFGLRPAPLSDFSPLRELLLSDPTAAAALAGKELRYEHTPERFDLDEGQVYARYGYAGAGIDLALYAASTLDKAGIPVAPARSELAQPEIALALRHPRYTAFGHAGAKPLGDFVLRWELGLDLERPLAVQELPDQVLSLGMIRRHQLNGLLGVTYAGLTDTRIWLEYAQRVVLDNPERDEGSQRSLFSPIEAPAIALRIRRTFMRERIVLTAVGTWLGVDPFVGTLGRGELEYELFDAFHVGIGYAMYFPSQGEPGPFYGFDEHDRIYFDARWDFALE